MKTYQALIHIMPASDTVRNEAKSDRPNQTPQEYGRILPEKKDLITGPVFLEMTTPVAAAHKVQLVGAGRRPLSVPSHWPAGVETVVGTKPVKNKKKKKKVGIDPSLGKT